VPMIRISTGLGATAEPDEKETALDAGMDAVTSIGRCGS
jgi:hypothetical protein